MTNEDQIFPQTYRSDFAKKTKLKKEIQKKSKTGSEKTTLVGTRDYIDQQSKTQQDPKAVSHTQRWSLQQSNSAKVAFARSPNQSQKDIPISGRLKKTMNVEAKSRAHQLQVQNHKKTKPKAEEKFSYE